MAKRALDGDETRDSASSRDDKKRKIQDEPGAESEPKAEAEVEGEATAASVPNDVPGLSNDDYTVGWICAITTEFVAAQAFLDERHKDPEEIATSDNNIYTLGKMGKHNVVITVLPYGEYGTASAATVASHMQHSFPNIRVGLMVGIGGGAPSKHHDIRLGDIVVSTPRDGKGGVIQYDFGKTIQAQSFCLTGFLDQPPLLLRTAVNALKAKYEIDGHQIEETIDRVFKKRPRLRKNYQRPDGKLDRLYRSDAVHSGLVLEETCGDVCGDEQSSQVVTRPSRTEEEDNPAIHYGIIASANQLMKDALIRDKLAVEQDVMCFEMEAAGLMNHFPCLIIRGICDYADSHKNKKWQGFAAMAAAAYAKDLLYQIPPSKIKAQEKIADVISDVQETVTDVSREVKKLLRHHHNEEDETILNWITPIDYAPQQNDFIKRRQPETGQWLLNAAEFQDWTESSRQSLFCPGVPGAGKTISAAIVIDDLHTRFQDNMDICVAFVFCNFRRHSEQALENLLASLLKQMLQQQPCIPVEIKQLFSRHKKGRTRLSDKELSRALQLAAGQFSRTFIVIDALDECQITNRCRQRFLAEIFQLQLSDSINLFTTSRFIPEIVDSFKTHPTLEIRANSDDIRRYLDGCMPQLPAFVNRDTVLQQEIKDGIVGAVDGMFLLAQLYMAFLTDKLTKKAIMSALRQFQKRTPGQNEEKTIQVLSEAYEQALDRIKAQKTGFRQLGERTLLWITCAKRPLTVSELRHALAVEPHTDMLDQDNLPETEDIISACAGLVTVDEESNIIRLVHYTMQGYFLQKSHSLLSDGEESMAKTCITYLSYSAFGFGPCRTDQELEARLRNNALYDYSARNWGHHAQNASASTREVILKFLERKNILLASSQVMLAIKLFGNDREYALRVPGQMSAAHVAAHFDIGEIMKALAERSDVDSRNSHGRTPLSLASEHGHGDLVKVLLERGDVNINSKDAQSLRSPLSWAAGNGHSTVCKLLLAKNGIEHESQDSGGRTALSWAAGHGHVDVVKLFLLRDNALLDSKATWWQKGRTPLLLAAANGHESVVQLLINTGHVSCDMQDDDGRTPLSYMVQHGCGQVSKELIARQDVNPNIRDKFSRTPLYWAIQNGHLALAEMLLANDEVDPNEDCGGCTPLIWAAKEGHTPLVKLLLTKDGLLMNVQDEEGYTALSWAVRNGHVQIVDTLLSAEDIDPSIQDKSGQTLFSWAVENGHLGLVKILLVKEWVDPARDYGGNTALLWAAKKGLNMVVRFLLEQNGVSANEQDKDGHTPLSWAVRNGYSQVVTTLLSKEDVNPNIEDKNGRSPLSWAVINMQMVAATQLLGKNAIDPKFGEANDHSPFPWVVGNGMDDEHQKIIKLLLAKDCLKLIPWDRYLTPFSWATKNAPPGLAEALLDDDPLIANLPTNNQPRPRKGQERHEVVDRLSSSQSGLELLAENQPGEELAPNETERGVSSSLPDSSCPPEKEKASAETPTLNESDIKRLPQTTSTEESSPAIHDENYSLAYFEIYRIVAIGRLSRVYLAQSKYNQRLYAIKVLKKAHVLRTKQINDAQDERRVLSTVKHPFLVVVWATWQDWRNVYMVMDFAEGGELLSLMRRSGIFSNPLAKFYAAEVTLALEYLHSKDIIYRDLRLENILLDRHGHIKLTDFRFAKLVSDQTSPVGETLDYRASELLATERDEKSVDWWSLGIIIFEMLCGTAEEVYKNFMKPEVEYPAHLIPEAKDLIENLVTSDLAKRLGNLHEGALDIKGHPWFEEISWYKLEKGLVVSPYIPSIEPGVDDDGIFGRYRSKDEETLGSSSGKDTQSEVAPSNANV